MPDERKTKTQRLTEFTILRARVAELEKHQEQVNALRDLFRLLRRGYCA
ncbi:MAG: hypothetical protein WA133_05990 [Syntrophales bacterium]